MNTKIFMVAALVVLMPVISNAATQPIVSNGQVVEVGGGSAGVGDDTPLPVGADGCLFEWDTAPTPDEFKLVCNDVDGIGTEGDVIVVRDGTDDVELGGGLALKVSEKLVFDMDGTANDSIYSSADGTIQINPNNTLTLFINSAEVRIYPLLRMLTASRHEDNVELYLGSGNDQTIIYNSATSDVTWNDGTNDVLTIPDDADTVQLNKEVDFSVTVIDCTDDPYTVPAGVHYLVADSDTGTCADSRLDVTLPAADCAGDGNACRRINIENHGTVQVDVAGNGGTETINGSASAQAITQWGSLTLGDRNLATTDWIIE